MLSIIIPTLNEEKYLSQLLDSIKKQSFKDYEIIVSDAGSKDRTCEIAAQYRCKIVNGGLPAKGRNEGAKVAQGEILLFLDSDTFLKPGFLEKNLQEFGQRKLDIASCLLEPMTNKKFYRWSACLFYNWPILALEKILPHGAIAIFVKRNIHFQLNGFDETIKLAEDHDYVRRGAKIGRFGILRSVPVTVSIRRYEIEGWWVIAWKYLLCELHTIFLGPVKSDIFKYRFDIYDTKKKK